MSEPVLTALIAAVVSLLVALSSTALARRKLFHELDMFRRKSNLDFSEKLYELRIARYGEAFDITDLLYRKSKEEWFQESEVRDVLKQLRNWKRGDVNLAISYPALAAYRELERALSANMGYADRYTDSQIEKIYEVRDAFRRELRNDIKFLHSSDHSERETRKAERAYHS